MKVLIITNLFPNAVEADRGVFNKQQFMELAKLCDIRVIAPLPWTPSFLSKENSWANVPQEEIIEGIKVYHPRYLVVPKVGRRFSGRTYYLAIKRIAQTIEREFAFDRILATWAYPDCYAASLLAEELNKPLVCRVHGSDINIGIQTPWRAQMITKAFLKAKGVIAVTRILKEKIVGLGIANEKISVIPNGIDGTLFKPLDKNDCRKKLSLKSDTPYVLFIGNLVDVKGVRFLIDAIKQLPENIELNILGNGELQSTLTEQTKTLGLERRVHFRGRVAHQDIPLWLNASNVFCLPSLNEGCPNVVLESLACGLPVVGSDVGGIPELIDSKEKGQLAEAGNATALARALQDVLGRHQQSNPATQVLSWKNNAQEVFKILSSR